MSTPIDRPEHSSDASLGPARLMAPEGALAPANYLGGDFSGHDFSGEDLAGCDFSGADLSCAHFVGANLRGASLFDVEAEGAEFAGANLAGAILRGGRFTQAGFGQANLSEVDAHSADFERASFANADLTGANLVGAKAADSSWREATLVNADLRRADLARADFTEVSLAGARFDDSDVPDAKLSRVKGFREASWLGIDAGSLDRRGACFLHDFIEDQNFIAEYRSQGVSYEWTYRIWWLTSDCGRSVSRWAACSAALAVLFAVAYSHVGIDYGRHETWLSPLYFSVVTLTTLGYGDVIPATPVAQVVVVLEVVIGYVMLGGLISLISSKLSRRAS